MGRRGAAGGGWRRGRGLLDLAAADSPESERRGIVGFGDLTVATGRAFRDPWDLGGVRLERSARSANTGVASSHPLGIQEAAGEVPPEVRGGGSGLEKICRQVFLIPDPNGNTFTAFLSVCLVPGVHLRPIPLS